MDLPGVSVIVPVYDGGRVFRETLGSVLRDAGPHDEVVVVSDGSRDGSDAVAAELGARVVRLERNAGPSAARNAGARAASREVLLFIDADVSIPSGLIQRVRRAMGEGDAPDALFGSYDDAPACPRFFSQYRNLLHHFTHQAGNEEAETFWAGCGAIRKDAFFRAGGFDESRRWLEDVELGYRLRAGGFRIRLLKSLQVKHHKSWPPLSMIREDVARRAAPWTALIWAYGRMPNDLNLRASSRWAAALVLSLPAWAGGLAVSSGPARFACAAALVLCGLAQIVLDRSLYAFLWKRRGAFFALRAVPCHWMYYACAATTFAVCGAWFWLRGRPRPREVGA